MPSQVGIAEIVNLNHFQKSVQPIVDDFMQAVREEYIDMKQECRLERVSALAVEEFEDACNRAEEILDTCNEKVTKDLRAVYSEAKDAFYLAAVTYNRAVIRLDKRREHFDRCNTITSDVVSARAIDSVASLGTKHEQPTSQMRKEDIVANTKAESSGTQIDFYGLALVFIGFCILFMIVGTDFKPRSKAIDTSNIEEQPGQNRQIQNERQHATIFPTRFFDLDRKTASKRGTSEPSGKLKQTSFILNRGARKFNPTTLAGCIAICHQNFGSSSARDASFKTKKSPTSDKTMEESKLDMNDGNCLNDEESWKSESDQVCMSHWTHYLTFRRDLPCHLEGGRQSVTMARTLARLKDLLLALLVMGNDTLDFTERMLYSFTRRTYYTVLSLFTPYFDCVLIGAIVPSDKGIKFSGRNLTRTIRFYKLDVSRIRRVPDIWRHLQ